MSRRFSSGPAGVLVGKIRKTGAVEDGNSGKQVALVALGPITKWLLVPYRHSAQREHLSNQNNPRENKRKDRKDNQIT